MFKPHLYNKCKNWLMADGKVIVGKVTVGMMTVGMMTVGMVT